MRPALRLVVLGLLLSTPHHVRAAAGDDLLTGYSLTSWTDDAGRPLGAVHAIVQDRDGFLWIGSDSGLLRFDGSRFTPWQRLSDSGVPDVPARSLMLARDGSLWIGFGDGAGVGRIRDGHLTRVTDGLDGVSAVTELAEDADGRLWAVGDRVLFVRESQPRPATPTWTRVALPWDGRQGQVYHPFVDRRGGMWVGTRWGVFKRDAATGAFARVNGDLVWGLGEDPSGRMWMTDIADGFRAVGAPATATLEGGGYRFIHDRHGNMWLATFGAGLWRVSRGSRGMSVKRAVVRTGLSSDSVLAIAEDRDGNLWVGTPAGLHRLTRRRLTSIDDSGPVLVTEPSGDGGLWVGTAGGLLHRSLAAENAEVTRIGTGAPDIRTFHTDGDGVVWMGTGGGLWRYDGRRLEKAVIPGRPQMFIRWLAPRQSGGLWLGDSDWLYRWDGERLEALDAAALGSRRIRFAGADRSGRVWLGQTGGRLGYLDADDRYHDVGASEGLPDGVHRTIDAVFEDRAGVVWIGGSGGVSRYTGGRIVTLGARQGLPAGRVAAIIDDEAGSLWVSMERNLVRLPRADVERALADGGSSVRYEAYDALDGLAGAAVGMINATRTPDGTLWFAQGGGLTRANPGTLPAGLQREPAPARIAAVVTNETRALATAGLSFAPGTRRLEIQYTAATLTDAKQVRFRYRLEGVDPTWVYAGTERAAVYTNLSPGAYVFRVESMVEGGAVGEPAEWRFAIAPQFWETRAFLALAGAVAALGIWAAWRVRLRLAERQFSLALAERARLSREIHDTLLQSLVGVALQVDAVSGSPQSLPDSARRQLVRIRQQVEAYIRDARQSIHDLRSPQLERDDLAGALRAFGRDAVASSSTRFSLTAPGTWTPCAPKIENQLLRIGQEAITNAVRHAQATRIRVDLTADAATVRLLVSDDGHGFEPGVLHEDERGHYGLQTMHERASELGGRVTITSTPGGTIVEAVVPIRDLASRPTAFGPSSRVPPAIAGSTPTTH